MSKAFRCFVFFLLSAYILNGQGTGNNPYSRYALGELYNQIGTVRNMGMGYSGVAGRSFYNPQFAFSLMNPSHLGFFRKKTRYEAATRFEMAMNFQTRQLNTSTDSKNSLGVNLAYLAMSVPVSKTWGSSVGIQPFSTVDYNISSTTVLNGNPVSNREEGRGGIYKLFWANGIGINKWATIGIESAVLLGNVEDKVLSNITNVNGYYSGFKVRNKYTGLSFKPGITTHKEFFRIVKDSVLVSTPTGEYYKDTIKKVSRNYYLNFGLTYDFFSSVDLTRTTNLFSVTAANTIQDDSTVSTNKTTLTLPGMWKTGLSLEKKATLVSQYSFMVNADFTYTNWTALKSGSSNLVGSGLENDTLINTWGVNIGAEFTPSALRRKAKTYRIGFAYTQLPAKVQGQTINDMSISLGASIPLGRITKTETGQQILPRINMALIAGQRGTTQNGLIRENYLKLYASLLINEIWFQKRRID